MNNMVTNATAQSVFTLLNWVDAPGFIRTITISHDVIDGIGFRVKLMEADSQPEYYHGRKEAEAKDFYLLEAIKKALLELRK